MQDVSGNLALRGTPFVLRKMEEQPLDELPIILDPEQGLGHIDYRSNSLPLSATFEQRRANVIARARVRDAWEPGVSWPTATNDPDKPTLEGLTWLRSRHQRDVKLKLAKPIGKKRRKKSRRK